MVTTHVASGKVPWSSLLYTSLTTFCSEVLSAFKNVISFSTWTLVFVAEPVLVGAVVGAIEGGKPFSGPNPVHPSPQKLVYEGQVIDPENPIEDGGFTVPPPLGQAMY